MTRCYKRPRQLQRCIQSVRSQSCKDVNHVLLHDDVGRGLLYANQQINAHKHLATGQYVYILDDDDSLIYQDFVKDLKQIVAEFKPDVIIAKGYIGGKLYPQDGCWKNQDTIRGTIGSCNFIVKNSLFQKYADRWCVPRAGDFFFIKAVRDNSTEVFWWNQIIFDAPLGHCRPEPEKIRADHNPVCTG